MILTRISDYDGRRYEVEVADHECAEHLGHRECDNVEAHGLECGPYERWREEWEECAVCGERFSGKDLDVLIAERDAKAAQMELGESQEDAA